MDNVAILIPMYNEAKTIAKVINDFYSVLPENSKIYVYDNNSSDDSFNIAEKTNKAILRKETKQGKGNVIRRMFREIDSKIYVITLGIFVIGLATSTVLARQVNYIPKTYEQSDDYIYRVAFNFIKNLPNDSKVLIISQADQGLIGYKFKFKFYDKNFTSSSFGDEIYHSPDIWTKNLSKDEFAEFAKEYDYIYFLSTDDNFKNKYTDVFKFMPEDEQGIYKINEILK